VCGDHSSSEDSRHSNIGNYAASFNWKKASSKKIMWSKKVLSSSYRRIISSQKSWVILLLRILLLWFFFNYKDAIFHILKYEWTLHNIMRQYCFPWSWMKIFHEDLHHLQTLIDICRWVWSASALSIFDGSCFFKSFNCFLYCRLRNRFTIWVSNVK